MHNNTYVFFSICMNAEIAFGGTLEPDPDNAGVGIFSDFVKIKSRETVPMDQRSAIFILYCFNEVDNYE